MRWVKLKRFHYYFIVAVSVVTLSVSSLGITNFASAADPIDGKSTEDQVKAWWFYKAMSACMDAAVNGNDGIALETNPELISQGRLIFQHRATNAWVQGYYMEGKSGVSDGRTTCSRNDVQVFKDGLKLYGVDPLKLVCAMGYTRNNNGPCDDPSSKEGFKGMDENTAAAKKRADTFKSQLRAALWGNKEPTLDDAANYALYARSLIQACTTGSVYTGDASGAAPNTIYKLKVGAGDQVNTYTARGDRGYDWANVYIAPNGNVGDSGGEKITCKQALDKANSFAVGAGYVTGCKTKYSDDADLVSACIVGAEKRAEDNGSNAIYCHNQFNTSGATFNAKIQQKQQACYSGYGVSGVEECIDIGYKDGLELQACTLGVANASNATYCTDPNGISRLWTDNKDTLIQACIDGQGLQVTPDTIDSNQSALPEDAAETNDSTSCAIDGVGWIVCPVVNFIGGVTDGSYSVIAAMLTTPVSMFNTSDATGKTTQDAWAVMRNIANVAFVIVFLIIIFSQITGAGVSNYGVKKMLPRLIIAAILVNVSFFICAILVDLSNIIGTSVKQIFDGLASNVGIAAYNSSLDAAWNGSAAGVGQFTTLIGGVIATTAITATVMYAGLSVLLPILLSAFIAVLLVVVVLTLRQALIVLLVIIAPLAFVAYLLPNTEDYFKKWRKLFFTLLMLFPIISIVFGASALAGKIVMGSSDNVLIQIVGAGITIIPLFVIPTLLKSSSSILGRVGSYVGNANRKPFSAAQKGLEGFRKNRQNLRNMRALDPNTRAGQGGRGAVIRWNARRKAKNSGREAEMNRANTEYIADQAQNNSRFRNVAAGGTMFSGASEEASQRALANAINVKAKLEADEVSAAKAIIEHANLSGSERQQLATTGSLVKNGTTYTGKTMQRASIEEQLRTGSMDDVHALVEASGGALKEHSQVIARGIVANGWNVKNPALAGSTLDKIAQGDISSRADLDNVTLQAIREGKFSAEALAGMHDKARERAIEAIQASGDENIKQVMAQAATAIGESKELSGKITGNSVATEQILRIKNL